MVREICVLPIKCKGCNSVFDLWYDLEEQDAAKTVLLEDREMEQFLNQSFCWHCRRAVLKGLKTEEDYVFGDSSEEEYKVKFE